MYLLCLLIIITTTNAQGQYTYTSGYINECNIITNKQCLFSTSDYSALINAFGRGMKLAQKYTQWQACETSFNQLFDDFNLMQQNNTISEDDFEGRLAFVFQTWSKSYADTGYNCFNYFKQVQKKFVDKRKSFLDTNDIFTSFLFSFLSKSYDIRAYSFRLIAFSREPKRWVEYSETVGQLIEALIYFDSSLASPFSIDEGDEYSPYYTDSDGNIQLKMVTENAEEKDDDISTQASESDELYYFDGSNNNFTDFTFGKDHPVVRQEDDEAFDGLEAEGEQYEFTFFSLVNFTFGSLDGALNAMPKGGLLNQCGNDGKKQREALIKAIDFYYDNDLTNAVEQVYIAMQYQYTVYIYCWFGIKQYANLDYLLNLIIRFKLIENFFFNVGYMWTDIIMLAIATPGETENDYTYYMAFYLFDFIFRWLFRQEGDGNCWYPWVTCGSTTITATVINTGVTV